MRLGFIGLGHMGLPMARRLLSSGHSVTAWNRSRDKLDALEKEGAYPASSPAEVMERSDLIGLCLTSDISVEAVAFGPEGLFSTQDLKGKVIADFSTGSPDAAVKFAKKANSNGTMWVDAPVSGGVPAATNGTLIIFAGGETVALNKLEPLLQAVSSRISHMGLAGSGQLTKICNQMIVASNMLVMAETIALARKTGIEVSKFADALKGGFADSTPLQIFGPRMAEHKFEPVLGAIALMKKDVGFAKSIAEQFKVNAPMLERVVALYEQPSLDLNADLSHLITLYEDEST
ncbi:MAG: NAD(P)-dependent oxidoreductase [Gammaproteobacteria bacterium]|nr:NAD(P)-dependent oxidoreductase [Gammaproteobacteria bacterium]